MANSMGSYGSFSIICGTSMGTNGTSMETVGDSPFKPPQPLGNLDDVPMDMLMWVDSG